MRHRVTKLALVLACTLLGGCPRGGDEVTLKGQSFIVELATNDTTRARGLMFREELAADRGMLFIFEDSAPRSFWMHNCKIALDILYFDENLRYVSGSLSTPPCGLEQCPNYPSEGAAKYVLELAAGRATELGIAKGDALQLNLTTFELPAPGAKP
jgi:uncharacterized protein